MLRAIMLRTVMRLRSVSIAQNFVLLICCGATLAQCAGALAQSPIPGIGRKIMEVGDDFEDPKWTYTASVPKSSEEQDGQIRLPAGYSLNRRWIEAAKRGQPDDISRVETPAGGIPGSKGAMMFRTLQSGIPGKITNEPHQDDLVASFSKVGSISVARSPSVVTRVYLPPFEEWEQRTGNSFGMRLSVFGVRDRASRREKNSETYWPGLFIHYYCKKTDPRVKEDHAMILIRSNDRGADLFGPKIKETGWWTLGMSCSPNGKINYYASPGVDGLTEKDYLGSYMCYGLRARSMGSFFFNVVNQDDGKSWSTSWIVDDPSLYVAR